MDAAYNKRLAVLDGLRGLAATAVVFYHAILHNDLNLIERVLYRPLQSATNANDIAAKLCLMLFNGENAVMLFFCLSGCVLHLSLARSEGPLSVVAARFTLVRLIRLLPTLWVCLLGYYAIGRLCADFGLPGFPRFTFQHLYENLLLYNTDMHGPSITIQSEVLAIPFILVAFAARKAFGSVAMFLSLIYAIYAVNAGMLVAWLPVMHANLLAFMAGMFIADERLGAMFKNTSASFVWLMVAAFFIAPGLEDHLSLPRHIAFVLTAALLVGCLLHNAVPKLAALLTYKPVLFLGRISYSLYLWNVIALGGIWAVTDRLAIQHAHPVSFGLLIGCISLVLTIPVAVLSERYIERPSIVLGNRVRSLQILRLRLAT